jgi:predicted permease
MADHEICGKCSQRNGCKQAYQQMADYKGPSVLGKVIVAFAVPLLSFVLAVAVFQELTAGLASKTAATISSLVLAVGTTAIVIAIIQVVNRKFRADR